MHKRKKRSAPVTKYLGLTIRETRPGYYMLDHQRAGRRERICFGSLEKAKTYARILSTKIANEGAMALSLSPAERIDAEAALKILAGHASLEAAAAFWARHNLDAGATVAEVCDHYFRHLQTSGARPATLRDREHRLGRLKRQFGSRSADSMMADDFTTWFDELHLRGSNRDSYRKIYRSAYQRAIKDRLCKTNPLTAIEPEKCDERLPTAMPVGDVRALMAAAEQFAPEVVPTLAVGFFCGLRPTEAYGLRWEQVDLKARTIRVMPETSKQRRTRIIDLPDNAVGWLERYARPSGPVGVQNVDAMAYILRRKPCDGKAGLLAAAGIKWIQDGPRKTYASAAFATSQDAARVAAHLGHTGGIAILFTHYRGLMTTSDAERYWRISPAASGKVIQLKGAGA